MKPKDMYQGFDPEKQQEYEEYWIKQGQESAELVYESRRRTKGFTKADYERVQAEVAKLHQDMAELIDKKLAPTAKEVQALVKRHFDWINNFYTPTKAIYIGLGQMYINHPDFRKVYDAVHPQLAEFLAEAMKVFADRELT